MLLSYTWCIEYIEERHLKTILDDGTDAQGAWHDLMHGAHILFESMCEMEHIFYLTVWVKLLPEEMKEAEYRKMSGGESFRVDLLCRNMLRRPALC